MALLDRIKDTINTVAGPGEQFLNDTYQALDPKGAQAIYNELGQKPYTSPLAPTLKKIAVKQQALTPLTPMQTPEDPFTMQTPQKQSILGIASNAINSAINKYGPAVHAPVAAQGYPADAPDNEKQLSDVFTKQGLDPRLGMGVWAIEGRGKTYPNNPFNIGAYDSNPDNAKAYPFKSPLEGAAEGARYLMGKSQYASPAVSKLFQNAYAQYQKDGDANTYLQTIGPTYSTNPNWAQVIQNTPEYNRWSYNQAK